MHLTTTWRLASAGAAFVLLAACAEPEETAPIYEVAGVSRANISVSVGSAGVVEPLASVEVKSKASGEVLELHVETGDSVTAGELLVRIDPRTVRNRLAQAEAELKAAQSRQSISESQMERAESLVKQGTFTEADYELAALELANAEAQVVSSRVEVENARIAVDDTEIRAPVSGTIIEKPVEKGQVISSPTQDVGGGTSLMKMADLGAVQVRALIDETDIGKVRTGMNATVTVAAYPNQPFNGQVQKIEPQAVVEQNVTMFAVIISIQNPDGLLLPGMNAEVDVSIARGNDLMTIPVMALRTQRDLASTAAILGVEVNALSRQIAQSRSGSEGEDAASEPAAPGPETINLRGQTVTLPPGVDAAQVRAILDKRRNGQELSTADRQIMRKVFEGNGSGGRGSRDAAPETDYRFGGEFWVVTESDSGERKAVAVTTGITDLDKVEVVSGLGPDDRVLILPSANLIETQERLQQFISRRVGGVPGMGGS